MISMARTFGAPDTVPAGNTARRTSTGPSSVSCSSVRYFSEEPKSTSSARNLSMPAPEPTESAVWSDLGAVAGVAAEFVRQQIYGTELSRLAREREVV
jgi:hypothetical protein